MRPAWLIPVALLVSLSSLTILSAGGQSPGTWAQAGPDHPWAWPRDLHAHPEFKNEWWYFTGHLAPVDTDRHGSEPLGFQLTFFRLGMFRPGQDTPPAELAARGGLMAHAAVTDPARESHVFSEVLWRAAPVLGGFGSPGDSVLAWCRGPAGTSDTWSLTFDGREFGLKATDDRQGLAYDLHCRPLKPIVLHGDSGFSPKNRDGTAGSLYASYTRMEVTGTVRRGETDIAVTGLCWMDREVFTNSLTPGQVGWDWVSLQLEDGRELMIYRLFGGSDSEEFTSGTLIHRDGTSVALMDGDFTLQPLETWSSPRTDADYPVRWQVDLPDHGISLELRAVMRDQENISSRSGVHYWEGAVTAHQKGAGHAESLGRGFIEMTGYGEGSRPPL